MLLNIDDDVVRVMKTPSNNLEAFMVEQLLQVTLNDDVLSSAIQSAIKAVDSNQNRSTLWPWNRSE